MIKSRREQQLDRTRRWEWISYGAFGVAFALAFALQASITVLSFLFIANIVLGGLVWLVQYRVNDELGRLRIMKSWAVVGVVNMFILTGLVVWATLKFVAIPRPAPVRMEQVTLPFLPVYLLIILSGILLSGVNAYLKWRDERE